MKTQSLLAAMALALMASASDAQPVARDGALADGAGHLSWSRRDRPLLRRTAGGATSSLLE